ncbi:hypothetical protein BP5796_10834 [Coleophoma crateriformis]|uniref:amidase n=1 Tax=Coleophoma crateriformis TaxID=565419 RepID=A0A3D8QL59_9HELO|nr:hypothetical protein BP5796_10834 [Coleophoma crateriformis]
MAPPYHIDDWKSAAAAKRASLQASIPKSHLLPQQLAELAANSVLLPDDPSVLSCGILTPLDLEITSHEDAAILLAAIASGKYTSVQVVEAFCKRASIAQQCTGCLTEILYDSASKRARELDEQLRIEGKTVGLLHGLPVSLKDCYDVEGVCTSSGLVSWLPNQAAKTCSVGRGIIAAGGILYVKTTCSQGMLMVETINNIFGTTANPYNLQLSVGGSSGGEAGLIAAKGSILGSGTDGGGSLRFPAAFCGLWALKPSKGRIPATGVSGVRSGSESVNSALGPMAKPVSGLELWLSAQLLAEPWNYDMSCNPMPWRTVEAERPKKKLVFGLILDDGVVRPTPPVTRALQIVTDAIQKRGHTVITIPQETIFSFHRPSMACTMLSNVQDGGRAIMKHISASGEPVVPRTATGSAASALTTQELFDNHLLRSSLAGKYEAIWQEFGMDAILAPAVAHPAPPHGKYISNSYATIYNMLDYVTGSIPVTAVHPTLDVASQEWYDSKPYDRIEQERFPYDLGDAEMKELYTSPDVFKDSPVGIQVVCRRLREEKCIGILKEIEFLLSEK